MIVKNLFNEIIPDIWPMIVIVSVIIISLRVASLLKGRKKWIFHKDVLMFIFIIYVLCLYHVVTFQDINYGTNNFTPFKEMFRYSVGSYKFYKNIIGNILLFVPFGFFSSYYLKNKKMYITMIVTLVTSLTIELVQYKIGRVFDIDDIILNILGGIIGYLLYIGIDAIRNRLPRLLRNDTFLDIVTIIIIIAIIIYSFNLNIFGWLK